MARVPIYRGGRVQPARLPDFSQRVEADAASQGGGTLGLNSLAEGLGELGTSLAARERQLEARQEEAEFLAAQNRAEELEREVFDPEQGFLAATGREAAERRTAALTRYDEGIEEIAANFSNNQLKRLWEETQRERAAAVRASLAEQGVQQTDAWLQEERGRLLEHHTSAAMQSAGDPERSAAHLEMLAFDAERFARTSGLDDAASDGFVKSQLTRVHLRIFEGLLDAGRPDEAKSYLDRNAADFAEEELALARQQVADDLRVKQGKALGDSLIEKARGALPAEQRGDRSAILDRALASLDSVSDPEQRAIARRRIETQRRGRLDPAAQAEREGLESEALAFVSQGGNPDDLPAATRVALGSETLARLRESFDAPQARRTDWALYGELSALLPEELASTDLLSLSGRLAQAELTLLRERQRLARQEVVETASPGETHRPFAILRRRQALFARLGLDPTVDREEIGRLSAEIDRALQQAVLIKGAPLSLAEENGLLREAAFGLETGAPALSNPDPVPGPREERAPPSSDADIERS